MAGRMTGKQRASQIPLDYFRQRDGLGRLRLALVILVPAVALTWWAVSYAAPDRGGALYTHGPLAAVHATWDRECEACHVPFKPIHDRTIANVVGSSLGPASNCESCHRGPIHHESQVPALGCASCHHDHNGRNFDLTRSPDSDCTQCHADLDRHIKVGESPAFTLVQSITRFDVDHPPFRLPEKDPGKLKFNHALHLAEGLRQRYTYGKIEGVDRGRYLAARPGATPETPVQLDCKSCHQLERGDFGVAAADGGVRLNIPAGSSGSLMVPVTYEVNCRGCHSLAIEPAEDEGGTGFTIRHGLTPAEVNEVLWGHYASLPSSEPASKPTKLVAAMPGRRPLGDREAPGDSDPDEASRRVKRDEAFLFRREKVAQADRILFGGRQTCAECHAFEANTGGGFELTMTPPAVPRVWMEHARFEHVAHRALNCAECHGGAGRSETSADVLMPSIDTCRKCHAPVARAGGTSIGGARHDCVECHRYHNGKEPLKGNGALARDAAAEGDILQFLKGTLGSKPTAP